MGLDLVEFVMSVEDAFGLSIPDRYAGSIRTPGELVDYLERRVPRSTESRCSEQQAFHALRRAALLTLGAPRSACTPRTRWDDLFPARKRAACWRVLNLVAGRDGWPRLTLRGTLPDEVATMGGTARWLAARRLGRKGRGAPWSRPEIQAIVRLLLRRQFGLSRFRWDQEFDDERGVR